MHENELGLQIPGETGWEILGVPSQPIFKSPRLRKTTLRKGLGDFSSVEIFKFPLLRNIAPEAEAGLVNHRITGLEGTLGIF